MDLFHLLSEYRVLVCKLCGSEIPPLHLVRHLRKRQPQHMPEGKIQSLVQHVFLTPVAFPPVNSEPLPYFAVYFGKYCPVVTKSQIDVEAL